MGIAKVPFASLRITLALAETRQGHLGAPPETRVLGSDSLTASSISDTLLIRKHSAACQQCLIDVNFLDPHNHPIRGCPYAHLLDEKTEVQRG